MRTALLKLSHVSRIALLLGGLLVSLAANAQKDADAAFFEKPDSAMAVLTAAFFALPDEEAKRALWNVLHMSDVQKQRTLLIIDSARLASERLGGLRDISYVRIKPDTAERSLLGIELITGNDNRYVLAALVTREDGIWGFKAFDVVTNPSD